MSTIEYIKLNEINPNDFMPLLNKLKIREHLIEHELFNLNTVNAWIKFKIEVDSNSGCKVRQEIFIHFLHTRPEYKFLQRISKKVYKSELLGSKFTTYQLAVK